MTGLLCNGTANVIEGRLPCGSRPPTANWLRRHNRGRPKHEEKIRQLMFAASVAGLRAEKSTQSASGSGPLQAVVGAG